MPSLRLHPSLWTLPDGRVLEWAQAGDPHGFPVIIFPGYLGSLHQLLIAAPWGRRNGLRLLAVNRPGAGRTSSHRYGTMTEHADDALHLLRGLGIGRFGVCGISLGTGYALALAHRAPDKAAFAAVVSGLCPMDRPEYLRPMYRMRRWALRTASSCPGVLRGTIRGYRALMRAFPSVFLEWANRFNTVWLTPDMPRFRIVKRVLELDILATLHESPDPCGLVSDLQLAFRWGFDPAEVRQRVLVWHGDHDTVVPLEGMRNFVRELPTASLRVLRGNHFVVVKALPEMMRTMARLARAADPFALRMPWERDEADVGRTSARQALRDVTRRAFGPPLSS